MSLFNILWLIVGLQRIIELGWAKKNADWMKQQGGYEVGSKHYPLLVNMHLLFFISTFIENLWRSKIIISWWWIPFLIFIFAQALRIWCMVSLGRYWNTRIWIVPRHSPCVRGPYRYLRHPNYLAVILEFLSFPLIFGAVVTSVVFSLVNLFILLMIRIPIEEQALKQGTSYEEVMTPTRFWPKQKSE
ncbi:isoprenylcysteine carboxyl methyltransferase family protein [Thermoflavimicrobium daqui]|uniref:isoprenylcysteine carboxyl methyltransferase family protein n=1 Tax=Thermoflavimicrobium daqui TaxID=2137476 RepID=UPI001F0C05A1|nr:isoprenylcysteine carboxylmethyltransferase family protein [Thermoflavimicrobium daqui]